MGPPEPEAVLQGVGGARQEPEQCTELDGFEALGLGPDLHDYREPYRPYLPKSGTSLPSSAPAAKLKQQYAADDNQSPAIQNHYAVVKALS